MRIYFKNDSIVLKNSIRVKKIFDKIKIKDVSWASSKSKIKLSEIQNIICKCYGYNNLSELKVSFSTIDPQISTMSDDEKLAVDARLAIKFNSYLVDLGVDDDISFSIAYGIAFALKHRVGDNSKLWPIDNGYLSYKDIASEYGITVPAAKKIIAETDILNGNFPVKEAIIMQFAITQIWDNDHGVNVKVKWNPDFISKTFGESNKISNNRYRDLFIPKNRYDVQDKLSEINNEFFRIAYSLSPGTDVEMVVCDENHKASKLFMSWGSINYEHVLANIGNDTDAEAYIISLFSDIYKVAVRKDKERTEYLKEALVSVARWANKNRFW